MVSVVLLFELTLFWENIEILGKKRCCNRHKESVLREISA